MGGSVALLIRSSNSCSRGNFLNSSRSSFESSKAANGLVVTVLAAFVAPATVPGLATSGFGGNVGCALSSIAGFGSSAGCVAL